MKFPCTTAFHFLGEADYFPIEEIYLKWPSNIDVFPRSVPTQLTAMMETFSIYADQYGSH